MSEVSARVCVRILDEFDRLGHPVDALLDGLPLSPEFLREPSNRIRWDEFTTILRRAAEQLGGIGALSRFGELQTADPGSNVIRAIARNVASVRLLYHLGSRWNGPSIFRCTEASCLDLPDGRIEQTIRILPGYRDSDEFFAVVRSALSVAPRLLGLPDARVEMKRGPNRATYVIEPPRRADVLARVHRLVRRLMARFALSATDEIAEARVAYQNVLEETLEETRRTSFELADKTARLETLNRLGRKLAEEKDVRRLVAEACTLLVEHCGADGVELRRVSDSGEELESLYRDDRGRLGGLHGSRDAPRRVETVELKVGARRAGELRIFGAAADEAYAELRKELIPWIALALDNANALDALRRQTHRLEREASERQIAEEKFREAQKMEAVGRLAGGFAHDLNNALTVIGGFAELVRGQIPADHVAQRDVSAIIEESERSAGVIKQLLAFSRASAFSPERLDLDRVLEEMERLLPQLVRAGVEIDFLADASPHAIDADRGQIEQLIVNLVVNASDAMPEGGRITISTELRSDSETDWVRLSVRDTGIGMDARTRGAMFEPFFTTKARGEGTGLGLAAVYGIVVERQGRISVDTEPGRGTEIRVDFRPADRGEEDRARLAPDLDGLEGNESILIVDDDPQVRSILCRNLEARGYSIHEAGNGVEAIERVRQLAGDLDIVVTDVVMPGMDGRELGRRLFDLEPELRGIVYVSGYAPQVVDGLGSLGKRSLFLHKPFSTETLLESVRSLLDAE